MSLKELSSELNLELKKEKKENYSIDMKRVKKICSLGWPE